MLTLSHFWKWKSKLGRIEDTRNVQTKKINTKKEKTCWYRKLQNFTYRQPEVILVFLMKLSCEMLCCWFRKFALFVQNVDNSCLFSLNQI